MKNPYNERVKSKILTVAIPAWNAKTIAWLAMESLCNQKDIDFDWEIIIMEEQNENAFTEKKFREYSRRLFSIRCKGINYISLPERITLSEKWKRLGELAHKDSIAFLLCACDCYSYPTRLRMSYDAALAGYDWFQCKQGCFYEVSTGKMIKYNGDLINWAKNHLNMGFRTDLVRDLPFKELPAGIDGWLLKTFEEKKGAELTIFNDPFENWRYGVDTHGLNNISKKRGKFFKEIQPPFEKTDILIENILPQNICDLLLKYKKKNETLNIIIRTWRRPEYFKNCIDSIINQTYKEINLIIGIEIEYNGDNLTSKYVNSILSDSGLKYKIVYYDREIEEKEAPEINIKFGKWFPYNKYLDTLGSYVKEGFVLYIDDDDKLNTPECAEKIMELSENENDLILWRVAIADKKIPNDEGWQKLLSGQYPILGNISGIGFCFHSKFLKNIEWGYWAGGDFRIAENLFSLTEKRIFIDETLTAMQNNPHSTGVTKKMKILFLYPSLISGWASLKEHGSNESSYIDHGLAMLSAVLKNAGHNCFLMDLRSFQDWGHFESVLKQQDFDFTITGFFSANERFARQAVEIVKRNFPNKYIIGGGVHLSVTQTREYPNIDTIVLGEGEPHILNIAEIIANGGKPDPVYDLKMVENFDSLPYVDRGLFNPRMEETSPLLPGLPEPFITIVAGRGCWGKCSFCYPSRNLINGDKCRVRSVDHFLGEIIELNKRPGGIGSIMIHDDLLGSKKWIEEFISKWNANLPRIPFWCQMRADSVLRIRDYIPALSDIGMSYVSLGLESGSQRMLDFLHKGTTVKQNIEACHLLHDNEINIFANYIVALPGETPDDLDETEKMLKEIKPKYHSASVYTSYPGSALYNYIQEFDLWLEPEEHYSTIRYPYERKLKGVDYDYIYKRIGEWIKNYTGELREYTRKKT